MVPGNILKPRNLSTIEISELVSTVRRNCDGTEKKKTHNISRSIKRNL